MLDYPQLENDLKNLAHSIRGASIIDLSFYHFWGLIGFYSRKETGNYFETISFPGISLNYASNKDILCQNIPHIQEPTEINEKKIFLFKTTRTETIYHKLNKEKFFTQEDPELELALLEDQKITLKEKENFNIFLLDALNILNKYDINLTVHDAEVLYNLIIQVALEYLMVYYTLIKNLSKISLIIMHADNHPPFIYWALAAKILRIPTLMLQHGIDCEPYFLDDCYTDYCATWGKNKKQRYETYSRHLPKEIRITGNPNYDSIQVKPIQYPKTVTSLTFGYIGRPHGAEKAYFDFRNILTGKQILNDLNIIAKKYPEHTFICKLHPYENRKQYKDLSLAKNIVFTKDSIESFFKQVDIVFSEDSSSAVETLLYGKPLILLNYEKTMPIVNLTKDNAGPTISNSNDLLQYFENFNNDLTFMNYNKGITALLTDYLGYFDQKNTQRVCSFIDDILKEADNDITFCTVITKNYLRYAEVLYRTLSLENPNAILYVLVVDGEKSLNAEYHFKIITIDELSQDDSKHMSVYYDAFELVCSMKPFIIDYLFKLNHEKVVYLDADIFVVGSFKDLSLTLDQYPVLFTPHYNSSPPIDNLSPNEADIAYFGFLNGGFWAFKKTHRSQEVLNWLMRNLKFYGFNAPEKGMFGDQLMIMNASFLFNDVVHILKDTRYNIGYWNMHERDISFRNGRYYVEDKEASFFHLSRYREEEPSKFTIDKIHRVNTQRYPVTQQIIADYTQHLNHVSHKYVNTSYKYKTLGNMKLDKLNRHAYFELVKDNFTQLNKATKNIIYVTDSKYWEEDNGTKARIISLIRYLKNIYNIKVIYLGCITDSDKNAISHLGLENTTIGILDIPVIYPVSQHKCSNIYLPIKNFYQKENIKNHFNTYVQTHSIDVCIISYIRWTHLTDYLKPATLKIVDTIDILHKRCEKLKTKGIQNWIDITKEEEYALYNKFDYQLAIQLEEYKVLSDDGFKPSIIYTPYAIESTKQLSYTQVNKITYIAGKNAVNDEAILWFLQHIWIYYIQLYPHIQLHIYGTVSDTLTPYTSHNLTLHGKISHLSEAYNNTDIVINPIRVGGGLKIKSVEALANGIPLITTEEGARGMEEYCNIAFLQANTKDEFLSYLIALTESTTLRKQLSDTGYTYAQENFGKDSSYESLIKSINKRTRREP